MAEISYENIKQTAQLSAGRRPFVSPQGWVLGSGVGYPYNGPPTLASDGVSIADAVNVTFGARLRADPLWCKSVYYLTNVLAFATIGIDIINASQVIFTTTADPPTEIAALKPAVALALVGNLAGSTVTINATYTDMLEVKLNKFPPFTPGAATDVFRVSAAQTVPGDATMVTEAGEVVVQLWGLDLQGHWHPVTNGILRIGGLAEGYATTEMPGFTRAYVQVLYTDGACVPACGPSVLELTADVVEATVTNAWALLDGTLSTGWIETIRASSVARQGRMPTSAREPGLLGDRVTRHTACALSISEQVIIPTGTATILLQANAARRGFRIRALNDAVYLKWTIPSYDTELALIADLYTYATTSDYPLGQNQTLTSEGMPAIGNALTAISNSNTGSTKVWVEEW